MAKLPPVPFSAPIEQDQGGMTAVWADWFKQLLVRVGGNLGQSGDWKSSQIASGYQKLPGGLVLQWGVTGSLSSASTTTVSFPTAFPTGCLQVIPGVRNNSAVATAATGQFGSGNYTTLGFDLYNRTSVALTFNWFAVGY